MPIGRKMSEDNTHCKDPYLLCVCVDPVKATTPNNPGGTTSRMTSSSQIENNIPNYMEQMKGMFTLAYIWAFGGNLHDRSVGSQHGSYT